MIYIYYQVRSNFPHSVFQRCSDCTVKDKISLCLKCGKQFCSTHGTKHFNLNNHSLFYELSPAKVCCGKCNREFLRDSHSSISRVVHIIEDLVMKHQAKSVVAKPVEETVKLVSNDTNDLKCGNGSVAREETNVPIAMEPNVTGLKNTGVICFFNSVLQNLVQTSMLRAALEHSSLGYSDTIDSKTYGSLNIEIGKDPGNGMLSKYLSFLQSLDRKDRSKAFYPYQASGYHRFFPCTFYPVMTVYISSYDMTSHLRMCHFRSQINI